MQNGRVPANWFWNFESGTCEGYGADADYSSHSASDLICFVDLSGSNGILFGYSTLGEPIYTAGNDKFVDGFNGTLYDSQCRSAADAPVDFCYQNDGNFVLYDNGTPVWQSHTDGTSVGYASMQSDGNLVVYDGSNNPVWDAGTSGNYGAFLSVRNDGCAVMYDSAGTSVLWHTGTCSGPLI